MKNEREEVLLFRIVGKLISELHDEGCLLLSWTDYRAALLHVGILCVSRERCVLYFLLLLSAKERGH